jgi:hypothetical protein
MRMFRMAVALQLVWMLAIPQNIQAQTAAAGQVAVVVPQANLERGPQKLPAKTHAPVFWGDVVDTLRLGRARVALDDGSVINIGSESSVQIVKHDAAMQQTEMDLAYGRIRSSAVRLVQPNGKYEIHTRMGTVGVVGTDFYLALEADMLRLIVFEGTVRFCNLAGVCITVSAGMMSTIRANQQPDPATITPMALLTEAVQSTEVNEPVAVKTKHVSPWVYVGVIALAAIPAAVISSAFGSKTVTVPTLPPQPIKGR